MAPSISGRSADLIETLEAGSGIVCLVGAGGKKSTIYHLVSRLNGRVAITSTVHTPPFRKRLSARVLVGAEDELRALVAGAAGSATVAYACPSDKRARLAGVDPDLVIDLHESCGFDLTLVKADGARLRWIKAPGPREPALPRRFSTLIPIVSMRAVGHPLDQTVAHRPGLLAELLGAQPGDRITPDHVARMLCDVRGGMKEHERADHVVPVINMVDTDDQRHAARLIAGQALDRSARIERVVLTRMACDNPVVEIVTR